MSFGVERLSRHRIDPERKYFLDANVWVLWFKQSLNPSQKNQHYLNFFENLVDRELPIYSHSLLISEIFNRVMRLNFNEYKKELPQDPKNRLTASQIKDLDFKRDYRKTDNYKYAFEQLQGEFLAIEHLITNLDKKFDPNYKFLIENIPNDADFNDFFYFKLAENLGLTVVTDDGDFTYATIEVLTENRNLFRI